MTDKQITIAVVVVVLAYIWFGLNGINTNPNGRGYFYCWNDYTFAKNWWGLSPHHIGRPVSGDHPCTAQELEYHFSGQEKEDRVMAEERRIEMQERYDSRF